MFDLVSVYNLMIAIYIYSAIGSALCAVIFTILACVLTSRRVELFLFALMLAGDFFYASMSSYILSNLLGPVRSNSIQENIFLFSSTPIVVMVGMYYLNGRMFLLELTGQEKKPWYHESIFTRSCFVIHCMFPVLILLSLSIQFGLFAGLILYEFLLFLWVFIQWPIQYLILGPNSTIVHENFAKNMTSKILRAIVNSNVTSIK